MLIRLLSFIYIIAATMGSIDCLVTYPNSGYMYDAPANAFKNSLAYNSRFLTALRSYGERNQKLEKPFISGYDIMQTQSAARESFIDSNGYRKLNKKSETPLTKAIPVQLYTSTAFQQHFIPTTTENCSTCSKAIMQDNASYHRYVAPGFTGRKEVSPYDYKVPVRRFRYRVRF
uniref:Uncharacterized protein n=1 Tax=Glossina brevipalpis TaxID=37001 RepID=A0A1A9W4S8_9MUSC